MSRSSSQPLSPMLNEDESDPTARGSASGSKDVADQQQEGGTENIEEVESLKDDEGQAPRVLTSPNQPSKEERRRHSCTHIPFRAWCDHCVRGRGRNRAARNACGSYNAAKGFVAKVHMDYAFFSVNAAGEECEEDEPGSRVVLKVLVLKETLCGSIWAYAVQHKGFTMEPWIRDQLIFDFDTIGLSKDQRIAMKNDQEPSLVDLVKEIARVRGGAGTALDESRVGDSNSNARVEVAVQEIKGMVRTLRSALEYNVSSKIPIDHPVIPWLVRHAGLNISRFQIRDDGFTAMHKMKGYNGVMPICEFGEVVHFRPHDVLKQGGYNDRFEDGVWLGFDARSGENLVGTEKGVYRTGSMRRKAPDAQWSRELLDKIVGTPETPVPGGADGRPPTYAQTEAPKKREVAQPVFIPNSEPPVKVRALYVQKKDVLEHGPTPRCMGCWAVMTPGMGTRTHSAECRLRFEQILMQSEFGRSRVTKVNEKLAEAIVDIHEQENKKRKVEASGEVQGSKDPESSREPENSPGAQVSTQLPPDVEIEDARPSSVPSSSGQASARNRKRPAEEPADEASRTMDEGERETQGGGEEAVDEEMSGMQPDPSGAGINSGDPVRLPSTPDDVNPNADMTIDNINRLVAAGNVRATMPDPM